MNPSLRELAMFSLCVFIAAGRLARSQDAEEYVINKTVSIPFSAALGIGVARYPLNLPPGTYDIKLTVERADWDKNAQSVADAVGIGGNYLIQDKVTNRDVAKSDWSTRNGWLGWRITIPANGRAYLFYSTITPLGAKGRLTVKKEPR